jgi:mannose-6-phosphate isomerase-like protein (cupin superfamily)
VCRDDNDATVPAHENCRADLVHQEEERSVNHQTSTRPSATGRQFVVGPEGLRATILTTAAETDGRHDVTDAVLPPGATVPLHLHTRYEERLFVLSGSLTVWAGSDKLTLETNDFYTIPTNVPHTLQSGAEGSRALLITSPAGFAELIARAGTPVHLASTEGGFDPDLFMAVTTELGDVVLGPPGTTPADLPEPEGE